MNPQSAYPTNNFKPQMPKNALFPENPKWNDLWASILFFVHIMVLVGISVWVFTSPKNQVGAINLKDLRYLVSPVSASFGATLVTLLLVLIPLFLAPYYTLLACFPIIAIIHIGIGAYFVMLPGALFAGIIFIVFGLICLLMAFMLRNRIAFSAMLVRVVNKAILRHPGIFLVESVALIACLLFLSFEAYLAVDIATLLEGNNDAGLSAALVYTAFSVFWTIQVFMNVAECTVSGAFATFFLLEGTGQYVANPIWAAASRSLTYSFGSICFGSLLVATIQFIRFILQSLKDQRSSLTTAIADCFLSCIEDLLCYFNFYAYTQIAVYGKSYIQAASDTFELIANHGIEAIVNDSILSYFIGLATFAIAIMGTAVPMLLALNQNMSGDKLYFLGGISVLISLSVPLVAFSAMRSGLKTLFVCYAQEPQAISRSAPELYNETINRIIL